MFLKQEFLQLLGLDNFVYNHLLRLLQNLNL
jgi:hypothetical protein